MGEGALRVLLFLERCGPKALSDLLIPLVLATFTLKDSASTLEIFS